MEVEVLVCVERKIAVSELVKSPSSYLNLLVSLALVSQEARDEIHLYSRHIY